MIILCFDLKRELLQNLFLSFKKAHLNPEGIQCAVPARDVTWGRLRVPRPLALAEPRSRPAAVPLPTAALAIFSLLPGRFGLCKAALRQPIPSGYANLWRTPPSGREPTRGQDGCRGAALACLGHWKKTHPFMWETGNSRPAPNISVSPPGFSWMSLWKNWFPRALATCLFHHVCCACVWQVWCGWGSMCAAPAEK